LNEKVKVILRKLSPDVLKDYAHLKVAILQAFKLSANVYLERRQRDETYVAFASKLKGLLDYYLESRRVYTRGRCTHCTPPRGKNFHARKEYLALSVCV